MTDDTPQGFIEECLGRCEGCSRPIFESDLHYHTVDGCWLCEEHAPMLSDVARQYREILAEPDFDPGELPFESAEEMATKAAEIEAEIAADGDRKLAIRLVETRP